MKYWKKWAYLILMGAAGLFYLSCVDKWQVYASTLEQAKMFCLSLTGQDSEKQPVEMSAPEENEEQGNVPEGHDEAAEDLGELTEDLGELTEDAAESSAVIKEPEQPGREPMEEAPGEPVYMTVEDDYFSDAVFIGDSRTVGMYEYGELGDISTFYASTGLTVYKIFDAAIVEVPEQKKKITVEEALQQNSFSKIYLMIGINEMGTGTVETFIEKYKEVVAHLQELQPDAILYIQGIMKVTTERSDQGDYINNEGIAARNEELEKLADNQRIFYLDVNPLICDDTGGMVEDYTFDGVHLKARYVEIWKDFLKQHAIDIVEPALSAGERQN